MVSNANAASRAVVSEESSGEGIGWPPTVGNQRSRPGSVASSAIESTIVGTANEVATNG